MNAKITGQVQSSTWRPRWLIEVVGVETRVEWEADNSTNFLLCLSKPIRLPPKPDPCRWVQYIKFVHSNWKSIR